MPGEIWPILTCHGVRQGASSHFLGTGDSGAWNGRNGMSICFFELIVLQAHEVNWFFGGAYENELIAGVGAGSPAVPISLEPEAISGRHDVK